MNKNFKEINEAYVSMYTKPIVEGLDRNTIARMDGIVTVTASKDFEKSISILLKDLKDEGFEDDEAKAYLIDKIKAKRF